jgi:acyl CoA:acetate/3-ketoacid CoA transferase beta subunit
MEKEQIREIIAKRVAMELKDGDVVLFRFNV